MIPTLDEFIQNTSFFPLNLYVKYEGFDNLYVRKNGVYVLISNQFYLCEPVVRIANVTATNPGNGAFTKLVNHIVNDLNRAVYVENAHNPRFRKKLDKLGFISVNKNDGPNYLFNFEGRLNKINEYDFS
jgi:hypothetical protein